MAPSDPKSRLIIDPRLSVHEQHLLVVLAARLLRRQKRLRQIGTRHGENWIEVYDA